MIRRNLIVVYKPIKTNSVILSETNHRLMNLSDIGNSCLNVTNNRVDHYCSWLPYGGQTIRDTEIGFNGAVAEAIGLYEGCIVSCKVVDEVPVLDVVNVTACNEKDWEMLEATSYRIQNTLLDQTKIVNEGQKLVIWVNKAMNISVKIDKLSPDVKYGKIENNTEFVVTPFSKCGSNGNVPNGNKTKPANGVNGGGGGGVSNGESNGSRSSLYERLFKKSGEPRRSATTDSVKSDENVIDSTELDNVSVASSKNYAETIQSVHSDDTESECDSESDSEESSTISNVTASEYEPTPAPKPKARPVRLDVQIRLFEALLSELKNQDRKTYSFRVISRPWDASSEMCNLFLTKHNTPAAFDPKVIYVMRCEINNENDERVAKEFFVNVKHVPDDDDVIPRNIYPTIEMTDILMAHLGVAKCSRITLSSKKTVLNFVEKIELTPAAHSAITDLREIEEGFKRLLVNRSRFEPMLINQDQIFNVCDGDAFVSVRIYPESFRYCLCDGEILRENKITINERAKDISAVLAAAEQISNPKEPKDGTDDAAFSANEKIVRLNGFEAIANDCIANVVNNLCLNEDNAFRKLFNVIVAGAQTTGKSQICKQILNELQSPPYHCHTEVFHCAQNKGRKTESISRDLRQILSRCVEQAPSILLLDNLDTLAHSVVEHTHDGEYYNRVSDIIQHLIVEYTEHNAITIIATISNKSSLNQRLCTSRGKHLFQKIYKIPDLEKDDRRQIIYELSQSEDVKCQKINYDKFANLTEGYTVGYLLQFVERAIFYAHRNDNKRPIITNEVLLNALKTTNAYCLEGIENNIKLEECEDDDGDDDDANGSVENRLVSKFPGLESVVSVFEEILIWPTKYPQIFERSPLRNQAGILLYGAPGTGKTYLVSQLSRLWNLRMISVKGPELLAKFIGQSEENVRNLFDRARSAKPCVLFFDEFDSLAPRRGHDSTGVTDRVVNQLLTELDGVEGLQGVVVIAATSRPELLDPALLRSGRIDRLVQCALPNRTARLKIFETLAKVSALKLDQSVDFKQFCTIKSDNYTGADIKSILVSANMLAVKECLAECGENVPDEVHICQKHLTEAFDSTRPSLSLPDVLKYEQMYARFMNREKSAANNRDFVAKRATLA